MKKYVIDRFEDNFAVLEKKEGGTITVDKSLLCGAEKGDIVIEKNGKYFINKGC